MKYFSTEYSGTTINLICSSLTFTFALGTKDWVLAAWCANAWFYTMILRSVIRKVNNAIKEVDEKKLEEGTDS